ncbi:MAG: bifunctional phosphoserine phosphatase/homoserine phosphotransferase ThrH [Candidatus Hodarchaeota archaeon]
MYIACLDLEGVFTPEIWISVAEATGIEELKLTTRDEPDYDKLMKRRLNILKSHEITLYDIQRVISNMDLLPGAKDFMEWLHSIMEVIIVSGTYIEFAKPLMKKLGFATLFCHSLKVSGNGMIDSYILRIKDMKKNTVEKLKDLNYKVLSIGDSYNDIAMLKEADFGILFRPPPNVIEEYPKFPIAYEYSDLKRIICDYLGVS